MEGQKINTDRKQQPFLWLQLYRSYYMYATKLQKQTTNPQNTTPRRISSSGIIYTTFNIMVIIIAWFKICIFHAMEICFCSGQKQCRAQPLTSQHMLLELSVLMRTNSPPYTSSVSQLEVHSSPVSSLMMTGLQSFLLTKPKLDTTELSTFLECYFAKQLLKMTCYNSECYWQDSSTIN